MRFLHDLRFALRGFRRNLGLTVVTVLVLALGIGANTAIFSVVDALVLRPLPFPAPQELVAIPDGVMYPDFVDLRAQARSFRNLALYRLNRELLATSDQPEIVSAVSASADLFAVLGVQPVLGRGFAVGDDEPGRGRVAVVSHRLWQRQLGSDPGAVGRTLLLDGQTITVIGVMPTAFRFPLDEESGDLWISMGREHRTDRQWRGYRAFRSIGRLAPGVDLRGAAAEVAAIGARLAQQYPKDNAGRTISISSYDHTVKPGRPAFLIVLAAVGVVLLIACANVANLQLVRANARRRELAIRAALGAGRGRIVRQFLTEGALLALLAGTLGLVAAVWGVDVLLALLPDDLPRTQPIGFDLRVLLYTLAAALGTALVVGIAPALQASRPNVLEGLRSGDRNTTSRLGRVRATLLVGEIALAVVLLAGAGLLLRSFARVVSVDPGFDPRSLLIAQLKVPPNTPREFYPELHRQLEAMPGVRAATIAREMPYGRVFNSWNFTLDDRPPPPVHDPWWANARGVSHSYFDTLGIAVLQGRGFVRADLQGTPRVAVINQAFARRYWPRGNPLGRHIYAYERDVVIVGVVADTSGTCDQAGCAGVGTGRLDRAPEPEVYLPNAGVSLGYIALRASGSSTTQLVGPLRATVLALSGYAILTEVRSMEAAIDQSLDQRRVVMFLLGAFAALAMVLAALGIYGVISYSVSQRTREIGLRMAVGANAAQVRTMVVLQGMRLCLLGLAVGVAAALGLTRLLASQLFGVSPTDPATFAGLAAVILAVSVLASLIPALRATRIDPMIALRAD